MVEPRRPLQRPSAPPRPAGAPAAPTPRRLAEPPAYRPHPLTSPGACVDCATPVENRYATPRCRECGRTLCTECYWRHGLTPTHHECTSCSARGASGIPIAAISGGLRSPNAKRSTPSAGAP